MFQEPYPSGAGSIMANSSSKSSQGALQVDASDPYSYGGRTNMVNSSSKSLQGSPQLDASKGAGSSSFSTSLQRNHTINRLQLQAEFPTNTCLSCTLEFDGACKGNPGPAGAGAILRAEDGSKVYRLREGVGTATNNVAEYRALILGLKQALKKGYKHIRVQGDSLLVCNQ
ncbi:hop-interacting protein thi034, partial [Trifolium pratense]